MEWNGLDSIERSCVCVVFCGGECDGSMTRTKKKKISFRVLVVTVYLCVFANPKRLSFFFDNYIQELLDNNNNNNNNNKQTIIAVHFYATMTTSINHLSFRHLSPPPPVSSARL